MNQMIQRVALSVGRQIGGPLILPILVPLILLQMLLEKKDLGPEPALEESITPEEIIERDFRKLVPNAVTVIVRLIQEQEVIQILADDRLYVAQYDDLEFVLASGERRDDMPERIAFCPDDLVLVMNPK